MAQTREECGEESVTGLLRCGGDTRRLGTLGGAVDEACTSGGEGEPGSYEDTVVVTLGGGGPCVCTAKVPEHEL